MPTSSRRGLVVVYTGEGKGKTTAALGMALRALGHGWRILVIQFFKGDWPVVFGELEMAKQLESRFEVLQLGKGFVGHMGDRKPLEEHRQAAQDALRTAREKIQSGLYDLIILDEILYAVDYAGVRLIQLEDVLGLVDAKPPALHLVLTGRNAPALLIERADLVTEMREIKHPWQKKIPAQVGIDY
ncbi:MAG: cob(I)yrinic acid a,c-diamide adenosyltransferase [Candidatus Omnitrophica bacterium]|nr:cob(I)yrinic acid a,c-diamide adenosyltransferase [Candidatus Omnitrophota bacterium]